MSTTDPIPDLKRRAAEKLAPLLEHYRADDIAVYLGTDRPRISEIRRGKLGRFSLETLIRYLTRLHQRVELTITPIPMGPGMKSRSSAVRPSSVQRSDA